MIDKKLKMHQRNSKFSLQAAKGYAKLLDQPSSDWTTEDFDGQPYTAADYRGKIVVLDFWYRSCPSCMQAIPHIKQLAEEFAGQQVVILGVNNDRDDEDARYVIDTLKITYPTLKSAHQGQRIDAAYNITEWPTLIVIDGKGIIRHVQVGDSPHLVGDLSKKIRELMMNTGTAN